MSFLSRKNSQPDKRGGRAADRRRADSEYDDYGYAPDAYQDDDDAWSPDEYFSPEGIKGRWAAGTRPGERSGVPGRGDDGYGYDDQGAGPQRARGAAAGGNRGGYQPGGYPRDGYGPDGYGQDGSYGNDDFEAGPDYGTGGYDLTEDDGGERGGGGRRRRERGGDRSERRLRLGRRDRSPDIWPDDEVSDEDYWASVSADRPFHSANDALDADPSQAAADARPMGRSRPAGAARHGGASESRLTADRPLGADRGPGGERHLAGDPRIAGEPRVASEQRTGSGRLGPPPGLSPAASAALSGQNGYLPGGTAPGRPATARTSGANSGPMARSSSGPMARSSSGPMARSSSGPMARSSSGPMARSSSGPMPRSAGGPAPAHAAPQMYPAPPAHAAPPARPAAGLAQPTFQPNGARAASRPPERPDWGERTERMDRVTATGYPEPRHSARPQDPRGQDSRGALEGQGVWRQDAANHDPRNQGRPRRGADDDPLTSKAWSRSALTDTDGRSYRVAARRGQVPDDRRDAALNEQTQTFSMPKYPADPQAGTARNPGHGAQHSGQHPYDRGTGPSHPYPSQPYPSRPATDQGDDRYRTPRPAGQGNNGYGTGGYGTGGYPGRR
jgi:hypothetical protein